MIDENALKSIERLHEMKANGILSEAEFEEAKQKLLAGKSRETPRPHSTFQVTELPAETDYLAWMLLPLRRYAQFDGRSSRREFWFFMLFGTAVALGLWIIVALDTGMFGLGAIGTMATALLFIFLIATFVPTIAVEVRRFHDQGRSGWFALLNLIPYVGVFIVLAFMLVPGTEGENEFGPDPLA